LVNYQVRKQYVLELECGVVTPQGCDIKAGFEKLGEFNGSGYYLSNQQNTWAQAKTLSEDNGGHLVSINTQEENDFIQNLLDNDLAYIGFNDADSEGDGAWANNDDVTLDLSYNNDDDNDYAIMNFWAGTWQMVLPSVSKKYIMEVGCDANNHVSRDEFILSLTQNAFVANLNWAVKDNENIDYFVVERSKDGREFEAIGHIKGDLINRLMTSYSFTDSEPMLGFNFYRIQSVSLTGKKQMTNLEVAKFNERQQITLYPNPADSYFEIDLLPFKGQAVDLTITNQFGQSIKTVHIDKVTSAPTRVELDRFINGFYQVQIQSIDNQSTTVKLVVAKGY